MDKGLEQGTGPYVEEQVGSLWKNFVKEVDGGSGTGGKLDLGLHRPLAAIL